MQTSTARRGLATTLTALLLAAVAAGCVPPPEGPPTVGAQLAVDPVPAAVSDGTTVAVTGNGYNAAGNLGTRPPFFGQPAGVYVAFGRFADLWKPSEGATGGARQIIVQRWALPAAQYNSLGGASNPELILMAPDGSFSTELTLSETAGTGAYGIVTYPGSGAINAGEEQFVAVSFAP